jgi:hypothetical protein
VPTCALAVTWTAMLTEPLSGTFAALTWAMLIAELITFEAVKSSWPLSSFTPPNCVVLAMRLTLLRIASTWSWLALISSGERAPVLAASLVRLWTSSSSELTFGQARLRRC